MKKFLSHVILESENICNLVEDNKVLTQAIKNGERIVFVGRRNTGKTSLVKSRVLDGFKNKKFITLFVDLMGVRNLEQINRRITTAFEKGLHDSRPSKAFVQTLGKMLKNLRPGFQIDPYSGKMKFTLGLEKDTVGLPFPETFQYLKVLHKTQGVVLIIDEFQDIAEIEEAEGLFRDALQQLPGDLPVILMGSKKHLLSKIFAEPKAPLANWGKLFEISKISEEDFFPYINERLKEVGLVMPLGTVSFLLQKLQFIPESINIVCDYIQRSNKEFSKTLSTLDIDCAVKKVTEERSSFFKEYLKTFTEKEEKFLSELARVQPLLQPSSKDFLHRVEMSPGGIGPLVKRLENLTVIYSEAKGYVISDPLFGEYLKENFV